MFLISQPESRLLIRSFLYGETLVYCEKNLLIKGYFSRSFPKHFKKFLKGFMTSGFVEIASLYALDCACPYFSHGCEKASRSYSLPPGGRGTAKRWKEPAQVTNSASCRVSVFVYASSRASDSASRDDAICFPAPAKILAFVAPRSNKKGCSLHYSLFFG